jgi:hypothetical protein
MKTALKILIDGLKNIPISASAIMENFGIPTIRGDVLSTFSIDKFKHKIVPLLNDGIILYIENKGQKVGHYILLIEDQQDQRCVIAFDSYGQSLDKILSQQIQALLLQIYRGIIINPIQFQHDDLSTCSAWVITARIFLKADIPFETFLGMFNFDKILLTPDDVVTLISLKK